MAERQPEFMRRQYEFAAHVRDPEHNPRPSDVEDRRMAIYRELFFNNVKGMLAGTFPVLSEIYGEDGWAAIIRDYFARHEAHTPLFMEMPQEFLKYLEEERGERDEDSPWLLELAHYEWVELALQTDEHEIDRHGVDPSGDLLDGVPVFSALAWPLSYRFPVHRIGPGYQPDEPGEQPTFLIVYRDLEDSVGFIEANPVTAKLVALLQENDTKTGRELLESIAEEMQHPNPDAVIQGGADILENLRRHDVVLGTKQ